MISSCPPPQRLEILHGDTGGDAELWVVLHWPVPVPYDQVTTELFLWLAVFVSHIEIVCSMYSNMALTTISNNIHNVLFVLCCQIDILDLKLNSFVWLYPLYKYYDALNMCVEKWKRVKMCYLFELFLQFYYMC